MDPLVMNTIDRASKFEPPLNDPDNSMSYVVAFEDGNPGFYYPKADRS